MIGPKIMFVEDLAFSLGLKIFADLGVKCERHRLVDGDEEEDCNEVDNFGGEGEDSDDYSDFSDEEDIDCEGELHRIILYINRIHLSEF